MCFGKCFMVLLYGKYCHCSSARHFHKQMNRLVRLIYGLSALLMLSMLSVPRLGCRFLYQAIVLVYYDSRAVICGVDMQEI